MSSLSIEKFAENLPVSGVVGLSQAAVGFGAGLLIAGKLEKDSRDKVAISLLAAGAAILIPVVAGVFTRVSNRPESARRIRRQLESIRQDAGLPEHEEEIV
ncbi:MAG TPA: hypothetical protein VIS74_03680 [Chthoniobacterales bacterium]